MWNQRAHFDIAMRASANEKPPQQMYISCNFCGKSISAFMQGLSRVKGPFGRLGSTSNKLKVKTTLEKKKQNSEFPLRYYNQTFLFRCRLVQVAESLCLVVPSV